MRIKSFSFESDSLVLQKIELQNLNLIVGRNGNGKSTTLFYLDYLIYDILNESDSINLSNRSNWNLELSINSDNYYRFELNSIMLEDYNDVIKKEQLLLNEAILIDRYENDCKIYSEVTKHFEILNPPEDTLVIHSRRDTKAYPFIEKILDWAKNNYCINFANIDDNVSAAYDIVIADIYNKLTLEQQEKILSDFNGIGFNISKIEYRKHNEFHHLYIHENGFNNPLNYVELSEGMHRSLCLLIFVEHLISKKKASTLLIDNLGEGLDYQRAIELGKILFKLCDEHDIQLIATTNDSFLMDVIDIDYWNVLERKGKVVSAINIVNSPKLFEDFRYTGLSNFDFFSSSYLPSRL